MRDMKRSSASWAIIKYIQDNPGICKNITPSEMANRINEINDDMWGDNTLVIALNKLVKKGVVIKYSSTENGKRNCTYTLNYYSSRMPSYFIDNAPASVQASMKHRLAGIKGDQYLSDDGCITTPNAVEKTSDPFSEDETIEEPETVEYEEDGSTTYTRTEIDDDGNGSANIAHVPAPIEEPMVISRTEIPPEAVEQEVSVPVHVKKDGKSMNITVNITLNL